MMGDLTNKIAVCQRQRRQVRALLTTAATPHTTLHSLVYYFVLACTLIYKYDYMHTKVKNHNFTRNLIESPSRRRCPN